MSKYKLSLVCVWIVAWVGVQAQTTLKDSLQKQAPQLKIGADTIRLTKKATDSLIKSIPAILPATKHSPRKAALYSIIPGGGQLYNKQYWKVPLVYGALFCMGTAFHYTNVRYKTFRDVYIDAVNNSKSEASVFVRDRDAIFRNRGTTRTLTLNQITQAKNYYRRYRDLNIILIAATWAINIVEANVAAHLKTFDISEDISLRFLPDNQYNTFTGNITGAKIALILK